MIELNDKNISATAFISDSAGKYVAVRYVIKIIISLKFTYIIINL